MQLSIIVTNYKTPELLKLCLESIKKTVINIDYKVFVMDAAGDEDTEFAAKENFKDFNYVPFEKNVGFRALVNEGLALVKGKYILILNSDIILTEDIIGKMIKYFESDSSIGLLAPQLLNLDGTIQESCFRFFGPMTVLARRSFFGKTAFGEKILDRFLMKDFDHQKTREVDWVMASAIMVKESAVEKVGLMDKRFFMYFEDVDWCRRFWQNGLKVVYFPEVKLFHYHLRVSKKHGGILDLFTNKYIWIHISSAIKYYWKYALRNLKFKVQMSNQFQNPND
ncbi:MAG: hypothetical protein A2174_02660 [Candidatus Portnoybacteria bacterium RBG_13_41_18]|uniref:Glycosyltransferase 2-like domain-containing protein n=1 Tax=Candidatus Portnoybacteria bacterium RBG_13_41_18 TaxID=1801991 RepID=A0A1G2F8U8_9BACT|nr:MAG: hypothetical protein A2174_02660 [Candidatus Portnoybacteria bacterium RBG_13_41_18]